MIQWDSTSLDSSCLWRSVRTSRFVQSKHCNTYSATLCDLLEAVGQQEDKVQFVSTNYQSLWTNSMGNLLASSCAPTLMTCYTRRNYWSFQAAYGRDSTCTKSPQCPSKQSNLPSCLPMLGHTLPHMLNWSLIPHTGWIRREDKEPKLGQLDKWTCCSLKPHFSVDMYVLTKASCGDLL